MTAPLLVIAGPTASGKSGLAIRLAHEFGGDIINCDSLQVYAHFNIGTAKLPPGERRGIPHHLIDVADAAKGFTAGDFLRLGRSALAEITARGKLPVVAGGTGFYLRALLDGLSPAPPSDAVLRERLAHRETRRPGSLHRLLRRLDLASAARIHPRDLPKLVRALEIRILSSRNPSELPPRNALENYRVLKLGLFPPREKLYDALDRRCEQMLSGGLFQEVRALLASGIPRNAKPFEALGYKEALAVIDGRMTPADALTQMRRDTRRYAKRQITWFRHEPGLTPLAGFGDDPDVERLALDATRKLLSS